MTRRWREESSALTLSARGVLEVRREAGVAGVAGVPGVAAAVVLLVPVVLPLRFARFVVSSIVFGMLEHALRTPVGGAPEILLAVIEPQHGHRASMQRIAIARPQ